MAKKFYYYLLVGFILAGCQKNLDKTDPQKERNNLLIETEPPVLSAVTRNISKSINGYYVALPVLYDSTSKNYPLLVTLHGAGTFGNGSSQLPSILADGVPRLLNEKKFPPSFTVNHQNFSFIVIAPQFSAFPGFAEVQSLITFAKKNYRIDPKRIYLTGLSMGSALSWYAGVEYSSQVAAITPISGIPADSADIWARRTAGSGLPVWSFQNEDDDVVNSTAVKDFIQHINNFKPILAPMFTLFPSGGHNAWTIATDPGYKENGLNIYEWMLQYKK